MRHRIGDLWCAIKSDEPTLQRYRSIRKDRELLQHLLRE